MASKEDFFNPNPKSVFTKDMVGKSRITTEGYMEIISELVRLDVPFLEIGSSSIGKSYSIREMNESFGIKAEFLFVGTEKAEFIEGIPNMKAVGKRTDEVKMKSGAVKSQVTEEVGEKFSYLKPYWFPNKIEIGNRLVNGRNQLENVVPAGLKEMWQYVKDQESTKWNTNGVKPTAYGMLDTLKTKLQDYVKSSEDIKKEKTEGKKKEYTSQYVYADAMQYISMLQGYGNFWLILDEIDKVSEQDKDKYAPLLHIVRERELKGWKLSGIRSYPEFDPKFQKDITLRIINLDKALDLFVDGADIDLTDTRIIAIANDLRTLEKASPALYRRFVKVVINKTLYIDKKELADPKLEENNPAKFYELTKRKDFNDCVVNKEVPKEGSIEGIAVKKMSIADDMAYIDPRLVGNLLNELNLQWTLGFLPEILFPGLYIDTKIEANITAVPNKIIDNFEKETDVYKMYFYKIISDNFEWYYVKPLMVCANQLIGKPDLAQKKNLNSEIDADQFLKEYVPDFNNPDRAKVIEMLDRYGNQLNMTAEKFQDIVDQQKDKKAIAGSTGAMESVYNNSKQKIAMGSVMVEKSISGGKPSKLTGMLMGGIPFIQQSFISHSPYIALDVSREFQMDMDDSMQKVISKLSGTIDDIERIQDAMDKLELDEEIVNRYGFGIRDLTEFAKIKKLSPAQTPDAVKEKQDILNEILKNKPVMLLDMFANKLTSDQKQMYARNTAPFVAAEKEVLQNLTEILVYIFHEQIGIVGAPSQAVLDAGTHEMLDDYIARFPYSVKVFVENPPERYKNNMFNDSAWDNLKKDTLDKCDKVINAGTYSELDIIKKP